MKASRLRFVRVARSLVTVLVISLLPSPVNPFGELFLPRAEAANSNLIQTNLAFDANATVGANDVASQMTFGATAPTYTNSGVGFYSFDNTSTKYAYKQLDFADNASVSIFMWVYPTAAGVILSHSGQADPYTGYRLTTIDYTSAGKFEFGLYNSGARYFASSATTPLNNWYYIGLTYDGATIRGYVNGESVGTTSMAAWTTSTSDFFHVGSNQNGTCFTVACSSTNAASFRFGELSIYRSALAPADVLTNYSATQTRFAPTVTAPTSASIMTNRSATFSSTCSGITSANGATACAYQWQQSTNNGSSWSDISGATSSTYTTPVANTALTGYQYRVKVTDPGSGSPSTTALSTLSTAANFTVSQQPGSDTDTTYSSNVATSAATVYATGGETSSLSITGAITLEAWVRPTGLNDGGWSMVVNKENAYELGITSSAGSGVGYWSYGLQGSSWSGVTTNILARLNEWHHVAITRAAGANTVNFYLDGHLAFTGSADGAGTGAINNPSRPFTIGARWNDGTGYLAQFKGQIDQVKVFNSARTANEIAISRDSYSVADQTNLIAHYDLNEGIGNKIYNRKTNAPADTDLNITGSIGWIDVAERTTDGPYTVVKFPRSYLSSSGGWRVPVVTPAMSTLVVGGGGGGGYNSGSGGGGGGVLYTPRSTLSGLITVTVGVGGLGAVGSGTNTPTSPAKNGVASQLDSLSSPGGNLGSTYPASGGAAVSTVTTISGAGGAGSATSSTPGQAGGTGYLSSLSGAALIYGSGGGGGGWSTTANGGAGGSGAGSGGTTSSNSGSHANANQGGGGGGSSAYVSGGNGGSGVILLRWITALSPTYTKPTNAFLNVGMTETFTTNVAQDSATVVLTRTFRWESTTPAANGVYTLIKQGTGAANASFSWVPTDTSTSGSGYIYRLTVTDSDTAGLFITDSSTAYALINRALVVSGNSTFGKTINVARSETFTITLGTSTYRPTLSPVIAGITMDTSTAGLAVVKISETMTVGTYFETLTVIDSVSASVTIPLTIKVVAPPTFSQSDAVVEPGLIYHLDPGNSASYARTGNSISDLSGRGRSGSLGFAFGNSSTAYTYKDGSTRNNAWQADVTCSAPTFSNTPVGNFSYSNGVCSYVPNVETVTTYTYDIWFKSSGSQTAWTPIVTTPYYNTNDQIMFSLNWMGSNTLAAGLFNGSTWYHTTTGTISSGVWTHATVTFNGTTLSLILNGDVAGKKTTSITAFTWNAAKIVPAIQFAKKWDGAQYFNGSIGSFRLYNRVLTTAEIEQNYFASSENYSGTINTPSKSAKYGSRYTDTYTAFSQANSATTTLASSVNGLRWDTSTSLNAAFLYQDTLTVGTYYDTITVSDNFGGSSFLPIALTVAKADTLTISMDTATAVNFNKSPITLYPKPTYRGLVGSDTLTVTTKFSSLIYTLSSTVPTNADTYTVIASDPVFVFGAASNYQAIVYETSTAVVNKISQRPLGIYMYGGVVGSPFLISLTGGDGDGVVTETLTGISNVPGCAISNHYLTSTTSIQGFCEVQVVKAASQNYFSESQTVQLYFMAYVNYQPNGQVGSGSTIAINGSTSLTIDDTSTVRAPNITSLSLLSGSAGTTIHIYGGNFGAGPLTIKFYRNKVATGTVASGSDITVTIPSGATTGPILVIAANGEATTPTFTVLP
jgi:hypothetical protein